MDRLPELQRASEALKAAEAKFNEATKKAQAKCKHLVVLARKGGKPFQYLDTYWQEARVCPACGLYEEGDWGRFKTLTTEMVVTKGFDFPIYSHRITCE